MPQNNMLCGKEREIDNGLYGQEAYMEYVQI